MFHFLALIVEFISYYTLFALGDYSIYHISNIANDILIKKKLQRTNIVITPTFWEWSTGNSISYIFIYLIYTQKIGLLYFNFNQYNIIYTYISPIPFFLLQDFMFYVMHRAAHIPFLYKRIHYIHHKYRTPTSWNGRISHYVDSNIENIAFTLPALIIPIYSHIWMICLIFTFLWGNFLHDSTNKIRLRYFNDSTDHCLHHYYGEKNCNFSYYFNHWDKFFGTYKRMRIRCKHKIELANYIP